MRMGEGEEEEEEVTVLVMIGIKVYIGDDVGDNSDGSNIF